MDTIAPRLSRTLLILAGCLAASVAEAALDPWSTGGPAGVGPINAVAIDPLNPLVVYAASGAGGAVSKSTDGGLSWQPVTANLPAGPKAALAIDPTNPQTVYVGVNVGGVFKSTDGGGFWTDVSNNNGMLVKSLHAIAVNPIASNIVYASTSGTPPNTIYRSTNGGGQWQQRSNGLAANVGIVGALVIDPTDAETIYAGTQSGLYKSTDSGESWVAINAGFTPDPTPTINAVAIDPTNPSIVYVGTGGFGVWKSVDGGASWSPASAGITSSLINDLVVDPQRPGILYAATSSSGVWRSTDGAQSWTALNTGLTTNTIQALAVSRSGTCVHAGGNVNGASGPVFDLAWVAGCGDLPSFQGLWWNSPPSSESGWGINFAHQNDTIFATWFTYDLAGKPWWLAVVANRTAPNVYSGDLFTTTGPAFNAEPFDPAGVTETPVGTATFTFADANNGTFDYTVNVPTPAKAAVTQTKSITRQLFAEPVPTCRWGERFDLAAAINVQDLWWKNPPGSESGWGINFTHQGDIIFATWFTYDLAGKPWWLGIAANKTGPNVYAGDLFTTTGPAFNAQPFDPATVVETPVGTGTFTLIDGNNVQFDYTVNGVTQSKPLVRQVFAAPGTVCE